MFADSCFLLNAFGHSLSFNPVVVYEYTHPQNQPVPNIVSRGLLVPVSPVNTDYLPNNEWGWNRSSILEFHQ